MVTVEQVKTGLAAFVDAEVVSKLHGGAKWAVGIGSGMIINNYAVAFERLKGNTIVQMMGVVDESGMIDIERLYQEARKIAAQEPLEIEIPMVGKMRFTIADLDKLYSLIMSAS